MPTGAKSQKWVTYIVAWPLVDDTSSFPLVSQMVNWERLHKFRWFCVEKIVCF